MEPVSRRPTRFSGLVAGLAAVVTVGVSGFYSWSALGVGSVGAFFVVVGLVTARKGIVTAGSGALVIGAFLAGVSGAPVGPLLVGVVGAIVAGDIGNTAIGLGEQLGAEASTYRLEATHMASTGFVGAIAAGVGYALFRVGTGQQPIVALVLLVVAAVLLVESIR